MKYIVLIMDGAAGWSLPEHGGQTTLEMAYTPNLDALAKQGTMGLALTVPEGMEPSSASACMSLLGYDPKVYYKGRAAIEARSMGVPVEQNEQIFRCNLVTVKEGKMASYGAGHISTAEADELMAALNEKLGGDAARFFTGVSYRHLLKLKGQPQTVKAATTPPHDISGKPIAPHLPAGSDGKFLRELMSASEEVLKNHPVNQKRKARGDMPATSIWLFWGSGPIPEMPPFQKAYGLKAGITSGVDLLRGLGQMMDMEILEIKGVTDGQDSDNAAQTEGALASLSRNDLTVIHVEAPDEAAHSGLVAEKIAAIEKIDREILPLIRLYDGGEFRLLVMPDHPTPIKLRSHVAEPVPFLLWGMGFGGNGATRFTEAEAVKTGLFLENGYNIMNRLVKS